MSTVHAGAQGAAPSLSIKPVEKDHEQAKYERMWGIGAYRDFAPGEHAAQVFLAQANPKFGDHVIDFGAGTGRGALMLALMGRVSVTMVDFAENCLDEDVRNALTTQHGALKFVKADLRKHIPVGAKYGFCTDVMEHIPTEEVNQTLVNILRSAQHVFFQISLMDDHFGKEIGEKLHLTVQPFQWWKDRLLALDAVIHWSHEGNGIASFYVTAWNKASDLVARGSVNTLPDEITANVRSAVQRNLPIAKPYDLQNQPVMILAGGPSITGLADEIIAKRNAGMPMVTVNGAYNWAIEHGLAPSAQIIVDARESNKKFVEPPVVGCKYLLASQCHPAVFDAAPAAQTTVWHGAISEELSQELDEHYTARGENWFPSPGGSTVMLRAFTLLRMLGFHRFEVYGFDSCLMDGEHHAYEQPENANDGVESRLVRVSCGNETFLCTPWMASQAQEFIDLIKFMGDEMDLVVHGNGLISHILKTAAAGVEVEPDTH